MEETAEVTVAAMVEASVVEVGEVLEAEKAAAEEEDSVEEGGLVAEEDLEHPAAEKAVAVEKARPEAGKAVVKVVEAVEEKEEEMEEEKEGEKVVVAAPARQSQLEGRDP